MNQEEKDYTISRIKGILISNLKKFEKRPPNLESALTVAAIKGELNLKKSSVIKETAKNAALVDLNYSAFHLKTRDIFEAPSSYKSELSLHNREKRQVQKENDKLRLQFQKLIDLVNLNRFEHGEIAINDALSLVGK